MKIVFCFRPVHKAETDAPQITLCFASGWFTRLKQTHHRIHCVLLQEGSQNTLCFASGWFTRLKQAHHRIHCFASGRFTRLKQTHHRIHCVLFQAGSQGWNRHTTEYTVFCFRPVHKAETDTHDSYHCILFSIIITIIIIGPFFNSFFTTEEQNSELGPENLPWYIHNGWLGIMHQDTGPEKWHAPNLTLSHMSGE